MKERIKGLISVVIPCRAKSAIFDFCIDSVNRQTYPNIEVIIVEGTNNNKNRNEGFIQSRGEYVFFLDCDVRLNDQCLEKMFKAIDGNVGYDIAYCHYFKQGKLNGSHIARPWDYEELEKLNYISTMSLVRASKFPMFDEEVKRFQDWELWLRMGRDGSKGVLIDEILFTAHYSSDGISMQDNYNEWFRKVKKMHNDEN